MTKKYISLIAILTFFLFSLTGCYDSKGIEDFYYIVAMGIDKKDDNLITLSIQIAKSSSSSSKSTEQSSDYKIYTVDCNSIDSGINILNNYLNKKISLSHCSVVVFSEDIAKEGIKKYVNILGNDTEIRPSCNVIISSKSAYDVLDNVSNSGENFSSRLYEYILTSIDYTGYTVNSNFSGFFSKINSTQTQATAIYGLVDDKTVQNCGAAVFKEDKMVGKLTPTQTIAHLILSDQLDTCMVSIDNPFIVENKIDLNLRRTTSPDIKIDLINNTPFISVNLELEATVDSSGQNFDYTIGDNIEKIEISANEYLESLLEEYLYLISKDYNSDIVGFGGILSAKYQTIKDFDKIHWNDIFKDSFFDIDVNTIITSSHLFNKE